MKGNRLPGKYFEEWNVGDVFQTNGRTITITDIVLFAGLSGDYNPLHTDILYAKNSVFKERVAHGLLVLAINSGQINQMRLLEGTGEAFLGFSESKFTKGVLPGDTITAVGTVVDKKLSSKGKGLLKFEVNTLNQRGEICSTAIVNVMVKRKSTENRND